MIYYVEDDENIRGLALYALKQAGLDALGFEDGESFFQEVDKNKCDLILLDIMLPGTDGLTLLSEIRANKQIFNTPVMMLSAKGTEYDKVSALDAGAEDFADEEDSFEIITAPADFDDVHKAIEDAGIEMVSAEVSMIPQTYVTLSDDADITNIRRILDLLDDDDDVQEVYHNWEE